MKKIKLIFAIFTVLGISIASQAKITGLGFVAPQIYSDPNVAVANPQQGELVWYDPTGIGNTGALYGYNGATWSAIGDSQVDSTQSYQVSNLGLSTSVSSGSLTIVLKDKDGNDPSTDSPVKIGFRNSTAANGTYVQRTISSAVSFTINSGSTLGTSSGAEAYLYIYAIDNAGTIELSVINGTLDEGSLQNSTAEGGGSANNANTLYSDTARSTKAVRPIGRIKITETTAGTWASNATEVALLPFKSFPRSMVRLHTHNGYGSTNTKIARFSTTVLNTGGAITYSDSASAGAAFTINDSGIYAITFVLGASDVLGAAHPGISVNSSQLSTSIAGITASDRLAMNTYSGAALTNGSAAFEVSWTGILSSGDVIRPHTAGNVPTVASLSSFTITKIAD